MRLTTINDYINEGYSVRLLAGSEVDVTYAVKNGYFVTSVLGSINWRMSSETLRQVIGDKQYLILRLKLGDD